MIDINELRKINRLETIIVTEHARLRLLEREISMHDIINCIESGEVIKHRPFPSCLILGLSVKGRYLHVVVSKDNSFIHLITAYYPDLLQWEADFKTRKELRK